MRKCVLITFLSFILCGVEVCAKSIDFITIETAGLNMFYYRGLKEWNNEKGYLTDTCLTAQGRYKVYLDYFQIEYK